jgi:2-dehydro-3-deoxygluconokinase
LHFKTPNQQINNNNNNKAFIMNQHVKKTVVFGEFSSSLIPQRFSNFPAVNYYNHLSENDGINVAFSLVDFGIPVDMITCLPKNHIGDFALAEMRRRGIGVDHVILEGDRIDIYFLETTKDIKGSKVVYDWWYSAMKDIKKEMIDWNHAFLDVGWFHWNLSTLTISEDLPNICLEAVKQANRLGISISVNLNSNHKFWRNHSKKEVILNELISYCDVVVFDVKEIEKLLKLKLVSVHNTDDVYEEKEILSKCSLLKNKFPNIQKIITTYKKFCPESQNSWVNVLYAHDTFYEGYCEEAAEFPNEITIGANYVGSLIYALMLFPQDNQKAINAVTTNQVLTLPVKNGAHSETIM